MFIDFEDPSPQACLDPQNDIQVRSLKSKPYVLNDWQDYLIHPHKQRAINKSILWFGREWDQPTRP